MTGLTAATLRKWEERYDIVQPIRLANGYREYTPEDLAALLWVKSKVDGGALVSSAAAELKQKRGEGWRATEEAAVRQAPPEGSSLLERWRSALLTALLDRNPHGVTAALDGAFASFGLETVLIEVVQWVLYEIGRLWETGEISEYQEHYSTVLLRDRLLALRTFVGIESGPRFVTACMPGEQHEIGPVMLGLLAARQGFSVTHLGYSPSPDGLRQALADLQPTVFGLSLSLSHRLHDGERWLKQLAETARSQAPGCLVVVGGRGVTRRATTAEGIELLPGDAREALKEIHQLLREVPPRQ